jgi:hypothetical protein
MPASFPFRLLTLAFRLALAERALSSACLIA